MADQLQPSSASPPSVVEPPSLTAPARRLGERVIELGIRIVAGVSILAILLIFAFVFREASPILLGTTPKKSATTTSEWLVPGEVDSAAIQAEQKKQAEAAAPRDPAKEEKNRQEKEKRAKEARAIVGEEYPVLTKDSAVKLSYLWHTNWQPNSEYPRYGIIPIILGSLKTTLIALLIAAPLSILAALYTAYFAPRRLREIVKPIIEILAGFPSVVVGYFCLMSVATVFHNLLGFDYRLNAIVGGVGLALAVIPIIYTITDDALRSVPGALREAALAIGATPWQAAYQVMLPAATPGIIAAVLLGIGRAFGETMIALMATGNAGTAGWSFVEPVRTFAATIGAEMGEVANGSPHYQMLFLLGVILFIFSFGINLITEFYVKRKLIKKFRGGA